MLQHNIFKLCLQKYADTCITTHFVWLDMLNRNSLESYNVRVCSGEWKGDACMLMHMEACKDDKM